MPQDNLVPAGGYRVRKRFRNEENVRHKRDLPWSKTILDLDNNKFLTRTPWAWFRIIAFYLVLYFFIALITAFWIILFVFVILKPGRPLWLKGAPGLSVVPGGSINFHPNVQTEVNLHADAIDHFLDKLESSGKHNDIFADCSKDGAWGYYMQSPCLIIKLNKVYGFTPETYDYESELPDNAPTELTEIMTRYAGTGRIWLTCSVEGTAPTIKYMPYPYFDATTNMNGINRVIGIQLIDMPQNEEITVTCKVWAKNIGIDMEYNGKGHTKFSMTMMVKT